ncbi:M81 family metallopeptidase [Deinococcus sp. UYEF24]
MRIAVGGIHTESSTYNPVLTTSAQFTVQRGAALLDQPNFSFLKESPHTVLPTLHARALPGGPVEHSAYQELKAEFLTRLRAELPLDGLYLAMHGAMSVEGLHDAEGDWITAAREVVGDACLISASYDLHGNVSQPIIDSLDLFTAYRTAPHIDVLETQQRAFTMLCLSLEQGERPGLIWVPVPVLMPGERTSTEDELARSLYAALPGLESVPGVLDVSLLVGYVWADEPRSTASVVVTGSHPENMRRAASEMAGRYWAARREFTFGAQVGTVEECVRWAGEAPTAPVVLADSGDNPTGGGVGDRVDVLREVLAQGLEGVIVAGVTDAPAVDICFSQELGASVRLQVGGSLDPSSRPVELEGTVLTLQGTPSEGRQAVVQVGGVQLVLAERRRPYHHLSDFEQLGLDPRSARLVVVKSGYLSPELAPLARPNLMALSPGVVDQDIPRLVRHHAGHPTFPFDPHFDWTPQPRPSVRFLRRRDTA